MDSPVVSESIASAETSSGIQAWPGAARADVLSLFQRMLPVEFFEQLGVGQIKKPPQNNRIYNYAVVMWLMIVQRLQEHGTLETAVMELVLHGLPSSFWPEPCKRLQVDANGRKPRMSCNTASYDNARQALPGIFVEQACDRTFGQLTNQMVGTVPAVGPSVVAAGQHVVIFDGTTARTARTPAMCKAYPPGSNQHGEGHFPLIRMVVAHDLCTGLAMRPDWGAMHGDDAVSEQALIERSIDRLPPKSVVVYDANSCFGVAYAADQGGHSVVLRLTAARAQRLLGEPLRDEIDRPVVWKCSPADRKSHRKMPTDASVAGRLIVRRVQPSDGGAAFLLALFTTLNGEADQIISLYGGRWNIETDLRSLKGTLQLEQLTCATPEMMAKEINLAMLAYNLVRAVTYLAAQKAGLPPRAFSFTRVRNVVRAMEPLIAAAANEQEREELWEKMMYYVGQAKLPKRRKRRTSYPRAVWGRPQTFPKRKA
jgi:hypothetical protein